MSVKIILEIEGQQTEVEMSDKDWEALTAIVARNGITPHQAIVQAIQNEDFIEQQTDSGGKLLVAKGDKLHELIYG